MQQSQVGVDQGAAVYQMIVESVHHQGVLGTKSSSFIPPSSGRFSGRLRGCREEPAAVIFLKWDELRVMWVPPDCLAVSMGPFFAVTCMGLGIVARSQFVLFRLSHKNRISNLNIRCRDIALSLSIVLHLLFHEKVMLAHMRIQMSMTGVRIGDGGSFREFDFYFSAKQSFSWSHSCTAVWGSSVIAQKFVHFLLPIFVFYVSRLDDFLEHWHTTLQHHHWLGATEGSLSNV